MTLKKSIQIKLLHYSLLLAIIGVNVGCDQVSKSMVRNRLELHENIHLIDNHVMLTKVENTGAFLSAGETLPPFVKTLLLSLFPALTLLILLGWLFLQQGLGRGAMFGICCVLGGGIGNIFDRIIHGSVTDFLYLHAGIFHTGIFNLADVSITGGVTIIIASLLFNRPKT